MNRFTVPTSAMAVTLDISNCTLPSCELQLFTVDDKTGQQMMHNCSNVDTSNCSLSFDTPLLGAVHHVRLQLLSSDNASVAIDVRTEGNGSVFIPSLCWWCLRMVASVFGCVCRSGEFSQGDFFASVCQRLCSGCDCIEVNWLYPCLAQSALLCVCVCVCALMCVRVCVCVCMHTCASTCSDRINFKWKLLWHDQFHI